MFCLAAMFSLLLSGRIPWELQGANCYYDETGYIRIAMFDGFVAVVVAAAYCCCGYEFAPAFARGEHHNRWQ